MLIPKQSALIDSPQALLEVTKHLSIPPRRQTLKKISTSSSVIEDELAMARRAWTGYQSTRKRDAVYDYLWAVFKIVRRWRKEQRTKASSHQALRATASRNGIRNREPFATVILCTSNPHEVDAKTRSKWSRVLRYTERVKTDTQTLVEFVKSNGGLNECARRFARNREMVSARTGRNRPAPDHC